jgi:transketolase|uniref:Transketolase n=1 Tax=candidate division WOR-3 bacterium TaxID=2052148 RepID=A0A7V3RGM7_UNCW3
MKKINFFSEVDESLWEELKELSKLCRGDILKMTTIAGSGHPGGSMSSVDIYVTLFYFANITPQNYDAPDRDRIIVSHGHTSPGLYSVLARFGFIDLNELLISFRRLNSQFEGHIERHIPGVEWTTGNLGQGLAAGCGFALAGRLKNLPYHTFVVMSDAEQAKGQVAEARRFAKKFNLNEITVLIDYNHFQISGRVEDVMPVNIKENYLADGWKVLEVPGHNHKEIHKAIKEAISDKRYPYAILCETTIGKGVSFMENNARYHGQALNREECRVALKELGIEDDIDFLIRNNNQKIKFYTRISIKQPEIQTGKTKVYKETTDPRSVFGEVLEEIGKINPPNTIAVFDCDLMDSVKTSKFARILPNNFFEAGVSEHSTATIAGALSINGILTIWADFGVFGIDEVYNQLRLNDINNTNLKIFATHLGYNVGPDGKTHHCIDYLGLLRNLFGFKVVIPGDPNQTDHIVRYVLNQPGNWVIGVGRTKLPVIKRDDGRIFFDEKYRFEYGRLDLIREGNSVTVFTMGAMLHRAIEAYEMLKKEGIKIRIYNVSSPFSIDEQIIVESAKKGPVITYEDHIVHTGIGNIIAQLIAEKGISTRIIKMGIKEYGGSDEPDALYKNYCLDAESLVKIVKDNL